MTVADVAPSRCLRRAIPETSLTARRRQFKAKAERIRGSPNPLEYGEI